MKAIKEANDALEHRLVDKYTSKARKAAEANGKAVSLAGASVRDDMSASSRKLGPLEREQK